MKAIRINSNQAPKALGPYSQAISFDQIIFCSGQIGIDPATDSLVEGLESQTKQVLENLKSILITANSSLEKVVKTEVFVTNMDDFAKVNEIYGSYFNSSPLPARQTIEVSALPKGALIEISCIAYK